MALNIIFSLFYSIQKYAVSSLVITCTSIPTLYWRERTLLLGDAIFLEPTLLVI